MAIFHMSFSNISAGKGRSAIASAAYRSGEKLFDDKEGQHYFYARSVMPDSFILTRRIVKSSATFCRRKLHLDFSIPRPCVDGYLNL
ncbi:MobA/MobL family protein (plasmid) [Lactiplantibacillus plantarum]